MNEDCPPTCSDYLGNFVYRNGALSYINTATGRTVFENDGTTNEEYLVKDNLGNIRTVVDVHEYQVLEYLSSYELASANLEGLFFDHQDEVRDDKPGSTDPSDTKAGRLNGNDPERRIGTAMMLKVMAGDKFNISADGYYEAGESNDETVDGSSLVESLISTLMGGQGYSGVPISELPENARTVEQALGNPALAGQLADIMDATDDNSKPKAHLNYLFFNSKMELVPDISGILQIPSGGNWVPTAANQVAYPLDEPGYIFVYIDNQSIGHDAWFDNVHIEHYTSSVLEEDQYYPFGLTISGQAGGNTTGQPYKCQGIELEKHFGLETYETIYRGLDPQLERFNGMFLSIHKYHIQ